MSTSSDRRIVAIVTACMTRAGLPTFARNEIAVSQEEAENGAHYYLAEVKLREEGYEEPYVHFATGEGPAFLHDAVREFLSQTPATATVEG